MTADDRFMERKALQDEIAHLRHWKAEAIVVLSEWDDVWKAAGCPGPLGGSKARNVEAWITDIRAALVEIRSAPDEVNDTAVCQTCHGDQVQLMGHDLGGRVKVLGAPCPDCCVPDEVNEEA